jgi:hypothetical protein
MEEKMREQKIKDQIVERKRKRLGHFYDRFEEFAEIMGRAGVEVRILNNRQQVQLLAGDYIANYYPRTGSYFLQKPTGPSIKIDPNHVLRQFLEDADLIDRAKEIGLPIEKWSAS